MEVNDSLSSLNSIFINGFEGMSKPGKLYCLFLCMFLLMSAYVYVFNLLGQRKNNVFEFFISFCVNFHEDFFENF